jgi:hypothetical protein
MVYNQSTLHLLYKKLITYYPRGFRERLSESMEQTFNDLYNEHKQQTKHNLLGFVLWTFIETAMGIFKEHLLLISSGDIMQTMFKTLGSSTLISLLLILPFMIMEVVNRRQFNEDFPFALFFGLWLSLFGISLILFPLVRARRTVNHDTVNPTPAQGNALITNSKPALVISILLILTPGIFPLLDSVGWLSLDRLFNGPNPEVAYLPGLVLSVGLIVFPIAAGIVAGRPIVRTLRAGADCLHIPFI